MTMSGNGRIDQSRSPSESAATGPPPMDTLDSLTHPIATDIMSSATARSPFSLSPRTRSLVQDGRSEGCDEALQIPLIGDASCIDPHVESISEDKSSSANESLNETKSSVSAASLAMEDVDDKTDQFDSLEYSFNSINENEDSGENDASSSISVNSVAELSRLISHASSIVKASHSLDGHEQNHDAFLSDQKKKFRHRQKRLQKMMRKYEQKEKNFTHQIPGVSVSSDCATKKQDPSSQNTPKASNINEQQQQFSVGIMEKNEIILPSLSTQEIEKNVNNLSKKANMPKPPFSFHCTICYDAFHPIHRPPIILPCGHTFICEDCGKRLTKCMECRKFTKIVYWNTVNTAFGGGNGPYKPTQLPGMSGTTNSAFSPPPPPSLPEHPSSTSVLYEDNPQSQNYHSLSGVAASNPAYSPRRYHTTTATSPRRVPSPRTVGGGDGGGSLGNASANRPQAPTPKSILASLPTVPLAKNVAMIGMMEACSAQHNALKIIEEKSSDKSRKKDLKRLSDDDDDDDSNVSSTEEDDEDEVYESGDDDDKVDFALGPMHWSGNHGTYAVKDEDGVVVLPKCPQQGIFPDFTASLNQDDKVDNGGQNGKKSGEPYLIQCGTLVQIVDVQNNIAKLARGRGYIFADSSQLSKIGPPRDELCQIEGMLHSSHHRRSELLALLQSSIMLEQGLIQQYRVTADNEYQSKMDNKMAWAAAKRLQERAAAMSPVFNGNDQRSNENKNARYVIERDGREQGVGFDVDPVFCVPSESQIMEADSIRKQKAEDSKKQETKQPMKEHVLLRSTPQIDERKPSAVGNGESIRIDNASPSHDAAVSFTSSRRDHVTPSSGNDHQKVRINETQAKVQPHENLDDSLGSLAHKSTDAQSVILGCGSFFALEPDENIEVIQHPVTPQRTPTQTSPSSHQSDSPLQSAHGSPSPPRIPNSSGSFDSVDFRTGRSGHAGLTPMRHPPHHHASHTTASASPGPGHTTTPSLSTPRLMSEHRGIARIRQIRSTANSSPSGGGGQGQGQGASSSGDQSWFSPFQAVSRVVLGGESNKESSPPSSFSRETRRR